MFRCYHACGNVHLPLQSASPIFLGKSGVCGLTFFFLERIHFYMAGEKRSLKGLFSPIVEIQKGLGASEWEQ